MDENIVMHKSKTPKTQKGYWNMKPIKPVILLYTDNKVLVTNNAENLQRMMLNEDNFIGRR